MTDEQIQATEAWQAYLEVRKAKHRIAPFTPLAKQRILSKLRMFAADGQDISEVLWTSVENGWTGIFEVRRKGWQPAEQIARAVTVTTKAVEQSRQWIASHSEPQAQSEAISARLKQARAKVMGVA